jgi:hypothetical protein
VVGTPRIVIAGTHSGPARRPSPPA